MVGIKIIGYGSLVSKSSLQKTVKNHSNFQFVWVHDYKRVFDIQSPKKLYEPWDTDVAVLNIEKEDGAKFNAIVFEVSVDDFHKLIEREKSYHLVKVRYNDYETDKGEGEAYMFIGIEEYIHKNINPNTRYFHTCHKAAHDVGKQFGEDWDKTTFLADGRSMHQLHADLIEIEKYLV